MRTVLRARENAIYRIINAGILAGLVLLGGQGFFGTGVLGAACVLMALAVLAMSAGLNFMALRGRLLCLSVLSILFAAGVSAVGVESSIAFFGSFFPWLTGNRAVSGTWEAGYGLLQTGLLTAMCYLVQILFEKLQALKMAAGILVFLAMVFCLLTRRELDHYGVAFGAVFCVTVWMEWVQGRWEKKRSRAATREAHTFWVMPFLAAYLVLLAIMPAPEQPYDWQWAKNVCGWLQEGIVTCVRHIKWGGREGFDMAFSGFSEDGKLWGEVEEESGRMMKLRVSRNAFGNAAGTIYLTGKVYNTFDGRGWYQNWQGRSGEVFLDTAEILYAVRNYNGEYQKDYLREVSLEIRYEDFNTGYIFAPLKTWNMGGMGRSDFACADGSLRWTRQKGYGTEYNLHYFRMNAGQQEFDRFLEEAGKRGADWTNRKIRTEVLREYEQQSGEIVTWDDVLLYRKEVHENYLGEVELSPEVSGAFKGTMQSAETDVETLRAIERTLRSLSYTLTPGALPGWVKGGGDFLDYFLLESRQGYCTYFATAFVLLARAEGIPARYVQGYCVPVPKGGEAYVDSSMAHAWPEAYLEGVGWIPFEPTPGYEEKRYLPWSLMQTVQETPSKEQGGALTPEDPSGRKTNALEAAERPEESGGTDFSGFWKFLGVGIPALLLVCAVALAADHAISRYRYQRRKLGEKFRIEVFRNLEILSWLGVRRTEWETLQELRERAEILPGPEGKAAEKAGDAGTFRFLEDYEKIVYGGEEAAEEMLENAVQAGKTLLSFLKKKKKWAYFSCRIGLFLGTGKDWK